MPVPSARGGYQALAVLGHAGRKQVCFVPLQFLKLSKLGEKKKNPPEGRPSHLPGPQDSGSQIRFIWIRVGWGKGGKRGRKSAVENSPLLGGKWRGPGARGADRAIQGDRRLECMGRLAPCAHPAGLSPPALHPGHRRPPPPSGRWGDGEAGVSAGGMRTGRPISPLSAPDQASAGIPPKLL